VLYSCQFYW